MSRLRGMRRAGIGGQVGQMAFPNSGRVMPSKPVTRTVEAVRNRARRVMGLDVDVGLVVAAADAEPPTGEPLRQAAEAKAGGCHRIAAAGCLPSRRVAIPRCPWGTRPPSRGTHVQVVCAAVGVAKERQLPVLAVSARRGWRRRTRSSAAIGQSSREATGLAAASAMTGRSDGGGGLDLPLVVSALQRVLQSPA